MILAGSIRLKPYAAYHLIFGALTGAGTTPSKARYFGDVIFVSEPSCLEGYGFDWLQNYYAYVKGGKNDAKVKPLLTKCCPVSNQVNAKNNLAHPK